MSLTPDQLQMPMNVFIMDQIERTESILEKFKSRYTPTEKALHEKQLDVLRLALQADALREALRATLANLCQAHGLPAHIESQARAALGATEGKEEE
jgi:hypothetical protein